MTCKTFPSTPQPLESAHQRHSLRAGWLEKRLRFQEDLLPVVSARIDMAVGKPDLTARAVIATVFACLDAASVTWTDDDGKGDIVDLYDECLSAVRGYPQRTVSPED